MIIGLDFDGTLVYHRFPKIGRPLPGASEVCGEMAKAGHKLILWTCRSNWDLIAAVAFVRDEMGIPLHGFNSNRLGDDYRGSPKLYTDLDIDDRALGCPLLVDNQGVHYVDWPWVRQMLVAKGVL